MSNETGCKCGSRDCSPDNKNNNKVKSQDEAESPWWINSPEHSYCFWKYVKASSGPDGSMKELVQSEIAELMGWSNTKTHFMLKSAISELVETLKANKAQELLGQDADQIVDFLNLTSSIGIPDDSNN